MRGTSMSTPIIAGNAALVREYFTKGFYPSGVAVKKDAFIPSGALIKAMLIHSARPLLYTVTTESNGAQGATPLSNDIYPSSTQGFGRVQLNNVLNFADTKASPLYLFVVGAAESSSSHYCAIRNGEVGKHIFYTTSDTVQPSIRITLSYTDYPGSSGASRPLVNDLTIAVTDGTGTVQHRPQSYVQGVSNVNNVAVILIDSPLPSTTYTVVVSATSTLAYTQPYALVMTGQITPVRQKTVRTFLANIKNYFRHPTNMVGLIIGMIISSILILVIVCIRFQQNEKLKLRRLLKARKIMAVSPR